MPEPRTFTGGCHCTIDGIDLATIKMTPFDGKKL
jgi:hypothetical protein